MLESSVGQTFSEVAPAFLLYARAELNFGAQSIVKYRDCLNQLAKFFGEQPVAGITAARVIELKAWLLSRNLGVSRQVSILATLKRTLGYLRSSGIDALDPTTIAFPKRQHREVLYLNVQEVERFCESIKLCTQENSPHLDGIRFRALVEALLGSAARIGELLSLVP